MTYTNKFGLPEEVVAVLTKNYYSADDEGQTTDYSATTICSPVQQTILKRRYPDELVQRDVIDNFWAFVGSIAHKVLEEHGKDAALIEKRFYKETLGKMISGQVDHLLNRVISDYKSTKVYKILKGDFSDWETQLNIYAYLARCYGFEVDSLRIITFLLDWKKAEAYKKNYPACPIVIIPLRLWSMEEAVTYITGRVQLLIDSEQLPDNQLPECTPQECWQSVKDFAVLKPGGKRAVKCYDSEEEAAKHPLKGDEYVEKRMTPRTRCLAHCPASTKCLQHKRLLIEEGVTDGQEQLEDCIF